MNSVWRKSIVENDENPFEMPAEWDHLPTLKELSNWMSFIPGIDYCWSLVKNIPKSRKHGWNQIQLRDRDGIIGQVSPMQLKRGDTVLDIILLCQGAPIPGGAPSTRGIVFKIDPELDVLLPGAKKPVVQPAPPQKHAAAR
jgi:hypothetical protein